MPGNLPFQLLLAASPQLWSSPSFPNSSRPVPYLYKLYNLSQPLGWSRRPTVRESEKREMKQITTAEARKHMAELLNRAAYGKERFVVTRHGKELVAIVPLEEVTLLDRLRALLGRKEFEAALAEVEEARTRPWEEVRRELGA